MDDHNVFATTRPLIDDFKAALHAQYGIEDLGETKYFMGIEILRDRPRRTLKLWQPKYNSDILTRFELPNFGNFGLVAIPTYPTDFAQLSKDQCPESKEARAAAALHPYRQLIDVLNDWDTT